MISIICSVGKNLEIGKNNDLVWHFSEDLKYFKEITMNHSVMMGYNTYKSLPKKLPGRKMIVITHRKIDDIDIEVVNNIDEVLNRYVDNDEEVFVIGGASIYREFLEYAKRLYITEIDATDREADTYFPSFNKEDWNKKILRRCMHDDIKFNMCLYEKKK